LRLILSNLPAPFDNFRSLSPAATCFFRASRASARLSAA